MTTESPEQLKAEWDAHACEWSRKAAREAAPRKEETPRGRFIFDRGMGGEQILRWVVTP